MGQPRPFSLVAQRVKHRPAKQETQVRSLGQEDLLEKEMATHSSTLAWKSPWMDEPGGLQSTGLESSPTPQFKSINSLAFNLLDGPTLISIHDY